MNGARIGFWLSGGWAVDFHVGRMTRSHSDIDFVVELRDKKTLWSLLEGEGAAHVVSDESGGVESFELDELRVEITYVMEDEKGSRVTPGFESWPWPEESLNEESVTLAGITTRVVSIAGLLDMKQGWEEHLGEKPRAHDLADIEALQAVLENPGSAPPADQAST